MHVKNKKLPVQSSLFIFISAFLFFTLFSCADEQSTQPAPIQPVKTVPKKAEDQIAAEKKAGKESGKGFDSDYTYNPSGKTDPFQPLIANIAITESNAPPVKEKKSVPLSPLQKLDVDDFTLVAVIVSDKETKALVEDPAMNGFIVKEGMQIGRNDGVIKKILPKSIIIEEQITDQQGNVEKKIQTKTLKKK